MELDDAFSALEVRAVRRCAQHSAQQPHWIVAEHTLETPVSDASGWHWADDSGRLWVIAVRCVAGCRAVRR